MVNRINTILQAKNITAKQFAEEVGVQPSGVSHILSGRNNPSLDFVMKVVRRYPEININWLMFGNGEMWVGNQVPVNSNVVDRVGQQPSSVGAQQPSAVGAQQQSASGNLALGNGGNSTSVNPPSDGTSVASKDAEPTAGGIEKGMVKSAVDSRKYDNLTLFDEGEPTLFSAQNEMQVLEHSSASKGVFPAQESGRMVSSVETEGRPAMAQGQEKTPEMNRARVDVASEGGRLEEMSSREAARPQLDENRSNGLGSDAVMNRAILGKRDKKIIKIVVLYDDHSFAEFSPAE